MRFVGVDRKVADTVIDARSTTCSTMSSIDPRHPLRERLNEMVTKFAGDLRTIRSCRRGSAAGCAKPRRIRPSPAPSRRAGREFKAALRRDCASPDGRLRGWLEGALINLGAGLLREPRVREALNVRIRSLLVELADRHGEDVAKLVSETIRGWDTQTIVEKLEANVGQDLQYIRLNGTIIGGLVGLILHAGAQLMA